MKMVPNQGIRLSLRFAIKMCVASGLIVGLLALLLSKGNPAAGILIGMAAGLVIGLWFGGLEVVEHGILRIIIARRDHAPLNLVHFLDYAAEDLNLLQKVGGGYMFIHRYLLEYFAGLEDKQENDPNALTNLKTSE